MRVLENNSKLTYKMGKNKKHRIRKSKENEAEESSDDAAQGGCPHVTKSVNLAALRKAVLKPNVTLGECSSCSKEGSKTTSRDLFGGLIEGPAAVMNEDVELPETTVCICLQCGHQGCDRNSLNKHALKHFKTPHSGLHSIIVNLTTWSLWCYACDDELTSSGRVQNCIDFLQKQMGILKPEPMPYPGRQNDSLVAEATSVLSNNTPKNSPSLPCVKVKGLCNLGNTCFFNAVMQSICQTRGLETLLVERSKQGKLTTIAGPEPVVDSDSGLSDEDEDHSDKFKSLPSIQTTYGDPGPITLALLNFIQEMKGVSSKNGTVNPTVLFTQVCKKAPRFKGYQQQDSHELLRYLVDCIRTEEIKRGQTSILKFFKLPETVNPRKVDEDTKYKVKEYGRQVKHTFLDCLFGGQLVSTVKCEECKYVSQIYESFLDLSLPVMEEKPQRPNPVLGGKKRDSLAEDDGMNALTSTTGLEKYDMPSKYQERKNRRIAKKEAKKKFRLAKTKSSEHQDKGDEEKSSEAKENPPLKNEQRLEASEETVDKKEDVGDTKETESMKASADSSPDGSKTDLLAAREDGQSSTREDPSDADIEDNLETDLSRLEISVSVDQSTKTVCTQSVAQSSNEVSTNGCNPLPNFDIKTNVDENRFSLVHENTNRSIQNIPENYENLNHKEALPKIRETVIENGLVDSVEAGKCDTESLEGAMSSLNVESRDKCDYSTDPIGTADAEMTSSFVQDYVREARAHSMNTLAARYHSSPKECSVMSCLNQFTAAELLTGSNKFRCKECTRLKWRNTSLTKEKKTKETVYSNANKQYLIFRPPCVLTLHLKRFEQTGLTSRKVNRHVDFPLVLDLAPYCSSLCLGVKENQKKVLYSLYGVVEHSGRLNGGHYTAYIKLRPGLNPSSQFQHTQPPSKSDLINTYMERSSPRKDAKGDGLENDKLINCEFDEKNTEERADHLIPPGRWFHISDSRVNEVAETHVLKAQAYLLFYERIY